MILGAFLGLSVASCADQNFDWEDARNQNPEYTFRTNFESLVGTIDPNQSWDFSYAANGIRTTTRSGANSATVNPNGDYYQVPNATISWMKDQLVEEVDNRSKGSRFELTAMSSEFQLIPIYQGHAANEWKLCMVVDGDENNPIDVWSKSGGIQYKDNNHTAWTDLGTTENTMSATDVRSRTITISGLTVGQKISFYLETTVAGDWYEWNNDRSPKGIKHVYGTVGEKKKSTDGMMVALACDKPGNITGDNKTVMLIGCEDNDRVENSDFYDTDNEDWKMRFDQSDWDMNDIVFLLVGEPAPRVVDITSKRYMVEDLGSTNESDIDFNDIVIDLEQIQEKELTTVNGSVQFQNVGAPKQRARVWAMGGTLDFFFLLKNSTDGTYKNIYHKAAWKDYKKMLNTDAATMSYTTPESDYFEISGWDPSTNNVAFLVCRDRNATLADYLAADDFSDWVSRDELVPLNEKQGSDGNPLVSGEGVLQLEDFPEAGSTPFIVAFDTNKQWRDERHKICSHWLYGTIKTDGKACEACGE